MKAKYEIYDKTIEQVLGWIRDNAIAIPDIQRPFVWKGSQVRDLIDSLYNGYPVGFLIIWESPNVRLKDGSKSGGKKILIDGQQRVMALMAALDGKEVLNDSYQLKSIRIAYNPWAKEGETAFEVQDAVHLRDSKWIPDISIAFDMSFKQLTFANEYAKRNNVTAEEINGKIEEVKEMLRHKIGVIVIEGDPDIEEITEIFVRINREGKKLNESDFAMSKVAADSRFGGNILRKAIDYFCHLSVDPGFWRQIQKDDEFMNSVFAREIEWLKNDYKGIYDPDCSDMLRVVLMHMFGRGKLKDLVALLSGRDFESRVYKDEIVRDSFDRLTKGVRHFVNQYNFQQFVQAIESAGFISSKLLKSKMTLDFAYTLYLYLHQTGEVARQEIKRYVQKWFVLSMLKGRYTRSPESWMDRDLRMIKDKGVILALKDLESAELGNDFWENGLIQSLTTSSVSSPCFAVFLAAQVFLEDKSLLSRVSVRSLISSGDVHHIFPKNYLKKANLEKTAYNQVANYTYLDTPVNIAVSDLPPNEYFEKAFNQCDTKRRELGDLLDINELKKSLATNCIPENIRSLTAADYESVFLPARRRMMAEKIRDYYGRL